VPQNYKFNGKERDPDMGVYDFGARFFQDAIARFYSPDWSATVEPVPYAKLNNPQSLNLYTYVLDIPLSFRDADGHEFWNTPEEPGSPDYSDFEGQQAAETADHKVTAQNNTPPPPPPTPDPAGTRTDPTLNPPSNSNSSATNSPADQTQAPLESRAHGQGERGQAGKASGTPNEEKVNKKARYDPNTKKWWIPDQNGKQKYLGPGFQPTADQLKKAGLAMGVGAAIGYGIHVIVTTAPEWVPYVAGAAAF